MTEVTSSVDRPDLRAGGGTAQKDEPDHARSEPDHARSSADRAKEREAEMEESGEENAA